MKLVEAGYVSQDADDVSGTGGTDAGASIGVGMVYVIPALFDVAISCCWWPSGLNGGQGSPAKMFSSSPSDGATVLPSVDWRSGEKGESPSWAEKRILRGGGMRGR